MQHLFNTSNLLIITNSIKYYFCLYFRYFIKLNLKIVFQYLFNNMKLYKIDEIKILYSQCYVWFKSV